MLGITGSRHRAGALLAGLTLVTAGVAVQATATPAVAATPHRILFDDGHAEEAGNADWIISTSKPDPLAQDSSPSSETDWTGALSSWGVDLQKTGNYSLKTATSALTYGGTSTTDLSKFDTLVLPEPNTLFTTAEKTAIMTFVKNGGGLFMISDH
ncbi:hydrolase, partial [Streptomyces griseorubiginosus]